MQKIFRKIFMFFFSVTMCMSGFLSQSIVQASAETITITGTNGLHGVADMSPSSKWTVSLPGTTYGVLMHVGITIAGHHAYCIEPYSDLAFDYYGNGTTNYTAKDLGTYFGNAETTQRLSEICYYGYGYDGDTSYDMDWATQIRIWQELGAPIGDIHPDIQAKIDQINEKLRICETKVSFFGEEVTLQGYGKENAATFTDENGVFQYYVDWKIEGIHSERNGNTLTVWAEPGDSLDTTLDYNCFYLAHQDNNASRIAYTSPGSQTVAYIHGAPDPNRVWVKVKRIPTTVHLSKQDTNSNEIAGAHLSLADADGNEIESWVSTNEPHVITDLLPGHYTMTESLPANGFVGASSVEFDVLDTGEVQTFTMVDEIVRFNKVDQFNKPVKDAFLSVIDESGNVIDSWISGDHIADIPEDVIDSLKEASVYSWIDEDGTENTISVMEEGSCVLMQKNAEGTFSYYDIDMEGNELSHRIQNLVPGINYTVIEDRAPKHYLGAEDMDFMVEEDGIDLELTMIDLKVKDVEISKQDITSQKELPGARLELFDEDKTLIETWISTNEPHKIKNLTVGKKYTLVETQAPNGYSVAESITFEIEDDGKVQHVVMYDSMVPTTGVEDSRPVYAVVFLASLICMIVLFIEKLKPAK